MALVKATLKQGIVSLMSDMRNKEELSDDAFAEELASLIDSYIKSATITVPAGIAVSTAGSPSAQTGATTAPAIATVS